MSKLVDTEELIRRTEEYLNRNTIDKYDYKEYKSWNDYMKANWKSTKANIYARMRAENKEKNRHMWIDQLGQGCFKEFFKKYGLTVYQGQVRFFDCGAPILTSYINNVVLPALENEMNIKGVKVNRKRLSGLSNDLFNWERAEIKEVPQENSN